MKRKLYSDKKKESRCVFVGNIPYDASEQSILDFFSSVAGNDGCNLRMVYDKATGQPKGYGFIEFPASSQAQSAIRNLDGKIFRGRSISVHEAEDNSVRKERSSKRRTREPTFLRAKDEVFKVVKDLQQPSKVDILNEIRELIRKQEQGARNLLMENPQLAQALLLMQLDFDMCSKKELAKVVEPVLDSPKVQLLPQPPVNPMGLPIILPPHRPSRFSLPVPPAGFPAPYPHMKGHAGPLPVPNRVHPLPLVVPPPLLKHPIGPVFVDPKLSCKPPLQTAFKTLDTNQQRVLKDVLALREDDINKLDPDVQKKIIDLRRKMST